MRNRITGEWLPKVDIQRDALLVLKHLCSGRGLAGAQVAAHDLAGRGQVVFLGNLEVRDDGHEMHLRSKTRGQKLEWQCGAS